MPPTIITLVDDTDLSVPGKGQQARTYELFSRVARRAEVRLVTQGARYRDRLSWASQVVVGQLPERLAAWLGAAAPSSGSSRLPGDPTW